MGQSISNIQHYGNEMSYNLNKAFFSLVGKNAKKAFY